MNALLIASSLLVCVAVMLAAPAVGAPALLVCAALAVPCGMIINRVRFDREFLVRLFVIALLARVLLSTVIYAGDLHIFFGPDALTYDGYGSLLVRMWDGDSYLKTIFADIQTSNWGMVYLVGAVYALIGQNLLAIQLINAVAGAATAAAIYLCAHHIFPNKTVARLSAIFVAFYPSLVLWSSQGLKDAMIVFMIVVTMLATLKLAERLSAFWVGVLGGALLGILAMRFYIFYMAIAAVGGALFIGTRQLTPLALARQLVVIVVLGAALTYLGVLSTASQQLGTQATLEQVQINREDQARGNSGYGADIDVSTASGALLAIPVGIVYLLFAPFPWQIENLRQSITLPEMLVWWGMFPLMLLGLWFTLKHRLRAALPILAFTGMLTVVYAVYQTNIGAAYRQRSQLLVFYFIFVAVGIVLLKEHRDRRNEELKHEGLGVERL